MKIPIKLPESRKLQMFLLCFIVSTGLLLHGSLIGAQWIDVIKWLFGFYAAGNVGEHMSKRGADVTQ